MAIVAFDRCLITLAERFYEFLKMQKIMMLDMIDMMTNIIIMLMAFILPRSAEIEFVKYIFLAI